MMMPEPQAEHKWLQQLVGEWDMEMDAMMGPDSPPAKSTGKDSVRSLTVWVVCDGEMPGPDGKPAQSVLTLGYDTTKKKFVGSFVTSCMTQQWIYEGELDSTGKVLTLDTVGPSFTDPTKTTKYQDIIEFLTPDHRTLSSQALGDDGKWVRFMTAHYRRKK